MPIKLIPYTPDMSLAPIGALTGMMITGMPAKVYHDRPELSTSQEKLIGNAPAKYAWSLTHPKPSTPEQEYGTAFEAALLEPELYHEVVIVVPSNAPKKPNKNQLGAKKNSPDSAFAIAWWDRFEFDKRGRIILKADEDEELWEMVKAVRSNPDVAAALSRPTAIQPSIFWEDSGVFRRGRPDIYRIGQPGDPAGLLGNVVIDLKTTKCAASVPFSNDCGKFGYWMQSSNYCDGLLKITGEPHEFLWIAAEKEGPWLSCVYGCPPAGFETGRSGRAERLTAYKNGVETGKWPGYQRGIHYLDPAYWDARNAGVEL